MPRRLAACDPCRTSKLSCNHERPCRRCSEDGQAAQCIYRERPFKRRRTTQQPTPSSPQSPSPQLAGPLFESTETVPQRYPNPGFLGSLSHVAIFDEVRANANADRGPLVCPPRNPEASHLAQNSAAYLEDLRNIPFAACNELIQEWQRAGANLALAGPIVQACTQTTVRLLSNSDTTDLELSALLLEGSCSALPVDVAMPADEYFASACCSAPRWETLAIFFLALSRAAEHVDRFPPLYKTKAESRRLQKRALRFADQCLEICLSLDCLNDLQIILQYENFIAHSMIDGDGSYHSWRKLGDVVSSLYALGYHERVEISMEHLTPAKYIRSMAFARAYSADKNVSIFLGRPHRMHRKHCSITFLPASNARNNQERQSNSENYSSDQPFSYCLETWWTFSCSLLKERVLDLPKGTSHFDDRTQQASAILVDADALWLSLPEKFRYRGSLKDFEGSAVERDFVASARLNWLHIQFLLKLALLTKISEPDVELACVAADMLNIAVQTILIVERLGNSGTGWHWKIIFYGLPAAGIICLTLLNDSPALHGSTFSRAQAIQDLSVLAANVESGTLIHPDEPNYALLAGATETIKSLLNHVLNGTVRSQQPQAIAETALNDPWTSCSADFVPWDFEIDFWRNLAEHPALYNQGL